MEKQFEVPLSNELNLYKSQISVRLLTQIEFTLTTVLKERSVNYERLLRESGKIIRETEEHNMCLGRMKERSMQS